MAKRPTAQLLKNLLYKLPSLQKVNHQLHPNPFPSQSPDAARALADPSANSGAPDSPAGRSRTRRRRRPLAPRPCVSATLPPGRSPCSGRIRSAATPRAPPPAASAAVQRVRRPPPAEPPPRGSYRPAALSAAIPSPFPSRHPRRDPFAELSPELATLPAALPPCPRPDPRRSRALAGAAVRGSVRRCPRGQQTPTSVAVSVSAAIRCCPAPFPWISRCPWTFPRFGTSTCCRLSSDSFPEIILRLPDQRILVISVNQSSSSLP
ncbi:hornerin-like [Iris pallida]|uniref:Hornerin-like n=1 Tax=Iris pallida TaxID=29817 RepID=A0AAX6DNA8_IRIPA|nr:hornerin-like [Iris pallida]